jgi:hypothetical protein
MVGLDAVRRTVFSPWGKVIRRFIVLFLGILQSGLLEQFQTRGCSIEQIAGALINPVCFL